MLALNAIYNHQGFVARAAARAVSDGAEIRPGLKQRGDVFFEQCTVAFFGFGRKKFKGNNRSLGRLLRRVNVANELHWQNYEEKVDESKFCSFTSAFGERTRLACRFGRRARTFVLKIKVAMIFSAGRRKLHARRVRSTKK